MVPVSTSKWLSPVVSYTYFINILLIQNGTHCPNELRKHTPSKLTEKAHSCKNTHLDAKVYMHFFKAREKTDYHPSFG